MGKDRPAFPVMAAFGSGESARQGLNLPMRFPAGDSAAAGTVGLPPHVRPGRTTQRRSRGPGT